MFCGSSHLEYVECCRFSQLDRSVGGEKDLVSNKRALVCVFVHVFTRPEIVWFYVTKHKGISKRCVKSKTEK